MQNLNVTDNKIRPNIINILNTILIYNKYFQLNKKYTIIYLVIISIINNIGINLIKIIHNFLIIL